MKNSTDNKILLKKAHNAPDNRREELRALDFEQLIHLFKTLPPANMQKLQGEVAGTILSATNTWGNILSWLSTHTPFPGNWVGKGFKANIPKNGIATGKGYNRFRILGIENRSMRFVTSIKASAVDGNPVLMMDYKPINNFLGWIKALDEVRQLDENNYLLCGYWFWPILGRSQFMMYHIYGPVGDFQDPH